MEGRDSRLSPLWESKGLLGREREPFLWYNHWKAPTFLYITLIKLRSHNPAPPHTHTYTREHPKC